MISRIEFPDGEELPEDPDRIHAALAELVMAHSVDIVPLVPGVYDVAPKVWTKHVQNHELTVLDNGTGLYRTYPREEGAGVVETKPEGGFTPFKRGGKVLEINEKQTMAVVAGGHPRKPKLQMYSLIAYTPGRYRNT
jgi:hypothetical protein